VVRVRTGLFVLLMLALVGIIAFGAYHVNRGGFQQVREFIEKDGTIWPSWFTKPAAYKEEPKLPVNHVSTPARDLNAEAIAALRAELMAQRQLLESLRKAPQTPPAPTKTTAPPPAIKRAPAVVISHERQADKGESPDDWVIGAWRWIPVVLESTVNSEIEGKFTLKTRKPVWDETGSVILIPQGHPIGARDESAHLLFGNERIPTFALSLNVHGRTVDLGDMPIMDATGTNGLTGEVDNHVWRLVWTSIFIEGLQAGQQVLNQEIASQGSDLTITGVGQRSTTMAQQRLGRAQDTRPTIKVAAGELANLLVTKVLRFPRTGKEF
jgi:type IV secretory pathway VirB10-like protein